jgi:hypothetical protein
MINSFNFSHDLSLLPSISMASSSMTREAVDLVRISPPLPSAREQQVDLRQAAIQSVKSQSGVVPMDESIDPKPVKTVVKKPPFTASALRKIAHSFYDEAISHFKNRDAKKTINRALEALNILQQPSFKRESKDLHIIADLHYLVASCDFVLGKVDENTLRLIEMAEELFPKFNDPIMKGKIHLLKGDYFFHNAKNVEDYAKAAQSYYQATKIHFAAEDLEAKSHHRLALCLEKTGGDQGEIIGRHKYALHTLKKLPSSFENKALFVAEVQQALDAAVKKSASQS